MRRASLLLLCFGSLLGAGCGRAGEAIEEIDALRKRACACETDRDPVACADKVQQDFAKFTTRHKDTRGTESERTKVQGLATKMNECLVKAASGDKPPPAPTPAK